MLSLFLGTNKRKAQTKLCKQTLSISLRDKLRRCNEEGIQIVNKECKNTMSPYIKSVDEV